MTLIPNRGRSIDYHLMSTPKSIIGFAEKHLVGTGAADTAVVGPEAEFFHNCGV
jgi:hypothetical protein